MIQNAELTNEELLLPFRGMLYAIPMTLVGWAGIIATTLVLI